MSRTEGVNVRAIPSPSPRYDRSNEAQFRRAMELSLERLNTRIQTVGLEDDETVLNPDADETISGDWDFTGSPSLPESSITDGSILARLADDETVSGTWTFSGTPVVIGSDPGGSETLRVGGEINADSGASDGASSVHRLSGGNGSVRLDLVADENNSGETNVPTLRLSQDGDLVRWDLRGLSGNEFRIQSDDSTGSTDALEIVRGGRMRRRDGGNSPSSGGLENIVHHGSGSPSAVGVEGTLHTQDA